MQDYQGNSKKSKEEGEPKERKFEPVVTGGVIRRDKKLGRKFKDTFFGGDAQHAARYVGNDVLLPALRNLIVDAVVNGVESLVYGERRRGSRPGWTNYGSKFQYGAGETVVRQSPVGRTFPPPPSGPMRGRVNRHEIMDIIIPDKADAEMILETMLHALEKYEVVSLADLSELLNEPPSHIDNKWGWTSLAGANIRMTRQGYLLDLPPLEEI